MIQLARWSLTLLLEEDSSHRVVCCLGLVLPSASSKVEMLSCNMLASGFSFSPTLHYSLVMYYIDHLRCGHPALDSCGCLCVHLWTHQGQGALINWTVGLLFLSLPQAFELKLGRKSSNGGSGWLVLAWSDGMLDWRLQAAAALKGRS